MTTDSDSSFVTRVQQLTVFKKQFLSRSGQPQWSRNWYWRKMVGGKSRLFTLGSNKRTAEKRAEEIAAFLSMPENTLADAVARFDPRHAEKALVATFATLLETYERGLGAIGRKGKPVSKKTFAYYRHCLISFIRRVDAQRSGGKFETLSGQHGVDYSEWLDRSTDMLTAKAVVDYKLAAVPADLDEEESQTARISADTTLRCTRALFSVQALRYFDQQGLKLPDLKSFMEEPDFGAKKYFVLLPPETIEEIMRASIALRETNTDAYRAFLLCAHAGLRRGEAADFSLSQLRLEDKPRLIVKVSGVFAPKHGTGRKVTIERWVYDTLQELGPVQSPAAFDYLCDWMTGLIGKENAVDKPIHELRKLFISYKAKAEGILAAAQQAGHKDPKVTATHYADSMLPERLLSFWTQAA